MQAQNEQKDERKLLPSETQILKTTLDRSCGRGDFKLKLKKVLSMLCNPLHKASDPENPF